MKIIYLFLFIHLTARWWGYGEERKPLWSLRSQGCTGKKILVTKYKVPGNPVLDWKIQGKMLWQGDTWTDS